MLKESIKDIILNGGCVKMSHKYKINQWFEDYSIFILNKAIHISPSGETFYNIDEAINTFYDKCFTSKNVGLLQKRLMEKKLINDEYDLENPNYKLKQLFKKEAKILDSEFKDKLK